jgi:hypothetical protein
VLYQGVMAAPSRTRWGSRRGIHLLLGAAIVGHLLVDLWVVTQDETPPVEDYATYLVTALDYQEVLGGRRPELDLCGVLASNPIRPPLPSLLGGLGLAALGVNRVSIALVGLLSLLLCALTTFALGRRFGGERVGLTAALLVLSAPLITGHSRVLMMDLPLTCAVGLTLLALWRAGDAAGRGSRRLLPWLLAGVALGAGLLIKLTFPLLVVGPVLHEALRQRRARHWRMRLAGIGVAAAAAGLLASPWYGLNLSRALAFYRDTGHLSATHEQQHVFSAGSLWTYLEALPDQVGLPLALLAGVGLLVLLRKRPPGAVRLLVAILVPLALFLFMPLRNARNTLPLVPLLMIALALAAEHLEPWRLRVEGARLRRAAVAGLCLLAPLQLALLHLLPLPGARVIFPLLDELPMSHDRLFDYVVERGTIRPQVLDRPWWPDVVAASLDGAPRLGVVTREVDRSIGLSTQLRIACARQGKQLHLVGFTPDEASPPEVDFVFRQLAPGARPETRPLVRVRLLDGSRWGLWRVGGRSR